MENDGELVQQCFTFEMNPLLSCQKNGQLLAQTLITMVLLSKLDLKQFPCILNTVA